MKRVLTVVVMGIATATLGAGSAVAACTDKPGSYPESEGWSAVDIRLTVPKGNACNVAVKVRIVGHQRTIELNESGSRTRTESPDEVLHLTNKKTGKKITKRIDGSFTDNVKGSTITSVGRGRNVLFGKGIRGFLWASGTQRFTVTHFDDPTRATIDVHRTKGRTQELCHALGARAVNGKDLIDQG